MKTNPIEEVLQAQNFSSYEKDAFMKIIQTAKMSQNGMSEVLKPQIISIIDEFINQ